MYANYELQHLHDMLAHLATSRRIVSHNLKKTVRNIEGTLSDARASVDEKIAGVAALLSKLKRYINHHYDVDSLCSSLPRRVEELIAAEGGRLKYWA